MKSPCLLVAALVAFAITPAGHGQTTPAETQQSKDQIAALVKEVRGQQQELTANQAKLEEKLAAVAEAIRQARIYSSRAGR